MAFQIFWKIKFKSLRAGTDYTVNIWKDGSLPSGYPLTLKGGASPFSTQEDDDEDIFLSVRTQSGYIRIVDDGLAVNASNADVAFDWKDMLPSTDTDRPVTLTDGNNTVVWQGFMQAQNFTGELYGNPQEREYPIQCPLSVLSASDVSTTERQIQNFAYVIKKAFDTIPALTFDRFIFQGGSDARAWLLTLVDWNNYVESEDDSTIIAKYDNSVIIDDICRYWGWACRVHGQSVYFSRVDDSDSTKALILTPTQLGELTSQSGSVNEDYLSTASIVGNAFVSIDNDETQVRGYRKAEVHANTGNGETTFVETYPDAVADKINDDGEYYTVSYGGSQNISYVGKITSASSAFMTFAARSGYGSFDYLVANSSEDENQLGPVIRILKSYTNSSAQAYVSINTVFEHSFFVRSALDQISSRYGSASRGNGLQLSGKILSKGGELKNEGRITDLTMRMRLGIGRTRATAQWFNGSTWGTTETEFVVGIGTDDNTFYTIYQSGRTTTMNKIIRTGDLYGYLFVEFLGTNSTNVPELNGERSFDIMDFKAEMILSERNRRISTQGISRNSTYNYISSNSGNSRNDWNSDLIYASDNNYMDFGYGVLIGTDGKHLTVASYNGQDEIPEQNLANRVADYWATSKRKMRVELNTNMAGAISPRNTLSFDGTTCHPISISHEWRDDISILTMLEL